LIWINRRQNEAAIGLYRWAGKGERMPSSTVRTFTDPDAYYAAIRAERVEGIVTASGDFRCELTRVDFDRLLMQRADEKLARVLHVSTHPQRTAIIFATDQGQPDLHMSGMTLSGGEIAVWDTGASYHHRSAAACRWGAMSLSHTDLAAAGEVIIGREVAPPSHPRRIRPPAPALSRLLNLHQSAGRLAKIAPDILAKAEVGRAMEQGLIEAMVLCLAAGEHAEPQRLRRDDANIMRRLQEVLRVSGQEPLYMAELCTAIGISYPALRACCQEHFGMSPKRYLWLHRMHLARRALRRETPETTKVTEIATNYGFWELGRFSVAYRSFFGESPSATLRRPPDDPKPKEITGSPWNFTKTA
jgi:AraC-like DNA-binding protein